MPTSKRPKGAQLKTPHHHHMLRRVMNPLFPRRPGFIRKADWDDAKWPIVTEKQVHKIKAALPRNSSPESQEVMIAAARDAVRMYWHIFGIRQDDLLRWSRARSDRVEMAYKAAIQLVGALESMDGSTRGRFGRRADVWGTADANSFDGVLSSARELEHVLSKVRNTLPPPSPTHIGNPEIGALVAKLATAWRQNNFRAINRSMKAGTFGAYALAVAECVELKLKWSQIDAAIQSMLDEVPD